MTLIGRHAVVIGASVAGLLAARAVSDHVERVTIVEREVLPPEGTPRRAVPQGRHVHALLPGGLQALEHLLPGFEAELVAAGAVRCASMREIRCVLSGRELTRDAPAGVNLLAGRPFVEAHIRRRVLALPDVTMLDGATVQGLVAGPDGASVTGVVVDGELLAADLVVVATGRAGQPVGWLGELGYDPPPEDELAVNIRYASRHLRIRGDALGADKLILVGARPGHPRGMGLFAQEDGTWLLTLVGYGHTHRPPTDDAGHLAFAATVAPPDVLVAIRTADLVDDVVTHTFPASRRRHYERMARFPRGLVVAGDAVCSVNPVYGQGMSVAACQAVQLHRCLARGEEGLARRYFKATRTIVDVAWDLAVGSDLSLPEVDGERSLAVRISIGWADRIIRAAEHDGYVAGVFGSVTDLVAPPSALLRPRFAWRVVRGARRTPGSAVPAPGHGQGSSGSECGRKIRAG